MNGVGFIYGTPNENSKPPYIKRLNFTEIDHGNIYSNVIITPKFAPLQKIRWILNFSEVVIQHLVRALTYIILGKNSIHEISDKEFSSNLHEENLSVKNVPDKIYLARTSEILNHRYLMHPSHIYRFFQVTVKGQKKGVLITTEFPRATGVSSFVVSDWLFSDRKVEKRIALFISKLRSHNKESEIISFWDIGGPTKIAKLFLGIIVRRKVSLISKDFRSMSAGKSAEFGDFHMGWSDNG